MVGVFPLWGESSIFDKTKYKKMNVLTQWVLIVATWICATSAMAQADTLQRRTMAYANFRPALVTLTSGKVVKAAQANVLLKGSVLVYRNPQGRIMEANRATVKSVDFDDRHYERIDTLLFWRVDTVGDNALYRATYIDMASLRQQILNSRNMTDMQVNSLMLSSTALMANEEDLELPYTDVYYFRYRGKWVKVHERYIDHALPRNKRQAYKVAVAMPGFSWSNPRSLISLLRAISD